MLSLGTFVCELIINQLFKQSFAIVKHRGEDWGGARPQRFLTFQSLHPWSQTSVAQTWSSFLSINCMNISSFCTLVKPLERQVAVFGLSVLITVSGWCLTVVQPNSCFFFTETFTTTSVWYFKAITSFYWIIISLTVIGIWVWWFQSFTGLAMSGSINHIPVYIHHLGAARLWMYRVMWYLVGAVCSPPERLAFGLWSQGPANMSGAISAVRSRAASEGKAQQRASCFRQKKLWNTELNIQKNLKWHF